VLSLDSLQLTGLHLQLGPFRLDVQVFLSRLLLFLLQFIYLVLVVGLSLLELLDQLEVFLRLGNQTASFLSWCYISRGWVVLWDVAGVDLDFLSCSTVFLLVSPITLLHASDLLRLHRYFYVHAFAKLIDIEFLSDLRHVGKLGQVELGLPQFVFLASQLKNLLL